MRNGDNEAQRGALPSVTRRPGQAAYMAKINIATFFVLYVHWPFVGWGQVREVRGARSFYAPRERQELWRWERSSQQNLDREPQEAGLVFAVAWARLGASAHNCCVILGQGSPLFSVLWASQRDLNGDTLQNIGP